MTPETDPAITRVPLTRCLECGRELSAVGTSDGSPAKPEPGDPIACIGCGAVMTIDAEGALRGFTEEEMDDLTADPEAMNNLALVVRRIHYLRKVN